MVNYTILLELFSTSMIDNDLENHKVVNNHPVPLTIAGKVIFILSFEKAKTNNALGIERIVVSNF